MVSANQIFSNLLKWESPIYIWYLEVSILHGLALFQILSHVVSLAKLLLIFSLKTICVDRNAPGVIQNCSSDTFYIPYSS